jgi:hypothetical protein
LLDPMLTISYMVWTIIKPSLWFVGLTVCSIYCHHNNVALMFYQSSVHFLTLTWERGLFPWLWCNRVPLHDNSGTLTHGKRLSQRSRKGQYLGSSNVRILGVEKMMRTRKTMMRNTSAGVTTMAKCSPIQLPDLLGPWERMLHDHVPNRIH